MGFRIPGWIYATYDSKKGRSFKISGFKKAEASIMSAQETREQTPRMLGYVKGH
jgi:hypothetical protein